LVVGASWFCLCKGIIEYEGVFALFCLVGVCMFFSFLFFSMPASFVPSRRVVKQEELKNEEKQQQQKNKGLAHVVFLLVVVITQQHLLLLHL
jgi:dipeptide/tripeptide permease